MRLPPGIDMGARRHSRSLHRRQRRRGTGILGSRTERRHAVGQRHHSEERRTIPSTGRDIRLLVMRPVASARPPEQTPGILWIHGGRLKTCTRTRSQIASGASSRGGLPALRGIRTLSWDSRRQEPPWGTCPRGRPPWRSRRRCRPGCRRGYRPHRGSGSHRAP